MKPFLGRLANSENRCDSVEKCLASVEINVANLEKKNTDLLKEARDAQEQLVDVTTQNESLVEQLDAQRSRLSNKASEDLVSQRGHFESKVHAMRELFTDQLRAMTAEGVRFLRFVEF